MRIKIKPCSVVGNAFEVVQISKFGQVKRLAIGLTKLEALCLKARVEQN